MNRLVRTLSALRSDTTARLRNSLLKKFTRERLEAFISNHATGELVLDIGCAHSPYAKYFPDRIAIDIVKKEKGRLDVIADVHHLPFKSESFPMVLVTEILSAIREPQRAIDEIERILKPNGKLVLTTRFVFPLCDTPHDFYRFTQYGLRHLLRNWNNVRIQCEAGLTESLATLLQRITFQSDFYGSKMTKALLLLVARVVRISGPLFERSIKFQYGDIARGVREDQILTSGYYLSAVKSRRNTEHP